MTIQEVLARLDALDKRVAAGEIENPTTALGACLDSLEEDGFDIPFLRRIIDTFPTDLRPMSSKTIQLAIGVYSDASRAYGEKLYWAKVTGDKRNHMTVVKVPREKTMCVPWDWLRHHKAFFNLMASGERVEDVSWVRM